MRGRGRGQMRRATTDYVHCVRPPKATALGVSRSWPATSPIRWSGRGAVSGRVKGHFAATGCLTRQATRISGRGNGVSQTAVSPAATRQVATNSRADACSATITLAVLENGTTPAV